MEAKNRADLREYAVQGSESEWSKALQVGEEGGSHAEGRIGTGEHPLQQEARARRGAFRGEGEQEEQEGKEGKEALTCLLGFIYDASGYIDTPVMPQVNSGAGFNGLLRNGYKSFSGTQDAVIRNIDACRELCAIHRTSLGPNGWLCVSCITLGMSKLVVNQLDKIFITSDTATIVKEMEVVHPAAKLLVEAAQKQEQEVGCLAWVRA